MRRSVTRGAVLIIGVLGALTASPPVARAATHALVANPAPVVVPGLREWTGGTGVWRLTSQSRIVVSSADQGALTPTATLLANELAADAGLRPPIAVDASPAIGDIRLALGASDIAIGEQGYVLTVGSAAELQARTAGGVFNGTRTLLQTLRGDPARRTAPQGRARDWPRYPERGQMLDVGRRYFSIEYLKAQIRQMAWNKLNLFHLHLSDWNGFRVESLRYPGLASPEHYTQAEIRDLVAYAHLYNVTIVPEIDLPAHAVHISQFNPAYAFSCGSLSRPDTPWEGADQGGWTLDVTKPATRQFILNLIDELLPLFDGPYFHVGGDEYPGDAAKNACPELVAYQHSRGFAYAGDVFTDFDNVMNARIRAAGKTTQLWQWWDFDGQQTSIAPDKNIQINEWLSDGGAHADAGYKVTGSEDGTFYVSAGLGQQPGDYGYSDPRDLFDYDYSTNANLVGYRISRWSDRSYALPLDNMDYFARRPLQVMADRTWGGPKAASLSALIDAINRVGDGEPGAATAVSKTGWRVQSASSAEAVQEDGAAANAIDNDPYTIWHTRYSNGIAPLPAELVLDTGAAAALSGFRYLPRQDGGTNGKIRDYEVSLATSAGGPYTVAATGQFPNTPVEQRVAFGTTTARFVKLRALSEWGSQNTFAAVAEFDVVRNRPAPAYGWTVRTVSSQETALEDGAAANAIDGNPATIWHTQYNNGPVPLPAEIVVDTGSAALVGEFRYLPRQDGGINGTVRDYEVYLATSPTGPWVPVSAGEFDDNAGEKAVRFTPVTARYLKFRVLSEWGAENTFASAAGLDLLP